MILFAHRRKTMQRDLAHLFRARLDQIINLRHELAQLAGQADWDFLDGEIAPLYSDKGSAGDRGTLCDRFVVAPAHLRLSDEGACER